MVVRRRKRTKGSVKRSNPAALGQATLRYKEAVERRKEFETQASDILAQLAELQAEETLAKSELENQVFRHVKGRPMVVHGVKLTHTKRPGKRKIDARALIEDYPDIWTHEGVVSVTVGMFEKLTASGVVDPDDTEEYITRGADVALAHIEFEEE